MSAKKITLLVLFGGRSPEHDVSVITGLQILKALDPAQYDTIPLYIAPDGQWLTGDALRERSFYIPGPEQLAKLTRVGLHVGPAPRPYLFSRPRHLLERVKTFEFDAAVPSFHGLFGEDGNVQGLFEVGNIPYLGMRTLAASALMDKAATKHILASAGIPLLPFKEIPRPRQGLLVTPAELKNILGEVKFPAIVKPAHLGSSIGVARVKDWQELSDVLPAIFRFDALAILEPLVDNLVEYNAAVCRVNGEVRTSAIERPKQSGELLDFKAKYMSGGSKTPGGTKTPGQSSEGMLSLTREINPRLAPEMEKNIRNWATQAFIRVGGTGAPRFDFLCNSATGEVWMNEVNPWPGSLGYFLWEAAPKPLLFPELLDVLVREALEIHAGGQLPHDPTPEDARLFPRR